MVLSPTVLSLAVLVSACGPSPARRVDPPTGPDRGCQRLHGALPDSVDGRDRRETTPSSTRTAAWGEPAVVLRCGVPRPTGLTATSELIVVDGVAWFLAEQGSASRAAYVFTSTGHSAYVEVRVPTSVPRTQATAPLTDLATAIKRALPTMH